MADRIRAGVLGTGFMGQNHGKGLAGMDTVTVAAICDTVIDNANALKESLRVDAQVYASFDDMLQQCPLDVLYVCLPPFAHHGQVEKAAAKGIHLFLEKPIAPDVARAESMVKAVEKAGVVTQVGFHMRFRTSVERLKELIDDGSAGRPTLFAARYWCNMLGGAWWRDRKGSGGQVYEQVIHLYDMAQHLLGPAASVSGIMENLCHGDIDDYTIEDTSVGTLRFASGAAGSIVGSNCALPDRFIGDWRVVCGNAVLDYRSTGDWRDKDVATLYRHGDDGTTQEEFTEDGDAYLAESQEFITAVAGGGTTRTPIQEGLSAVRLVSAVIASAEAGGAPVALNS